MTLTPTLRLNAGELIVDLELYLAAQERRANPRTRAGTAAEHLEIVRNLIEKKNHELEAKN